MFKEFESITSDPTVQATTSQQDKRKAILQEIITLISKNISSDATSVSTDQIDPLDMDDIIMPNMCKILSFYSLASEACPENDIKVVDENTTA